MQVTKSNIFIDIVHQTYSRYLDFVNIMAYDYSGPWDRVAGHNSPLTSQKQTIEHMIKKPDCMPSKLNLGMGAYG